MKKIYVPLLVIFIIASNCVIAQPGKDGAKTVTATGVVFNRYDVLTTSVTQGAIFITVNDINNLSANAIAGADNNPYQANFLSSGDLLMIIKMQGATIDATNAATYGNITNYNGTGSFELVSVQTVTGNNIYLTAGLQNTYTISATGRVQVIRIPRLTTLTVNGGASITAQAWGASYKGGMVALETSGDAVINGAVTTSGLGFRGGQLENDAVIGGYTGYVSNSSLNGAEKGESIAGYQADYDAIGGRYGRGAPANGGGGGNAHNAGGGGGANAGAIASWTGMGTPDISNASWIPAWNLEGAGFANSSSSGGGRGGYSYSRQNRDALSLAPGQSLWGGDDRKNIGGYGGRPLAYVAGATLFMGGGGGSGDANALSGSSGANGGGVVYMLVAGNLSGSGSISANGANAANSTNLHTDGMGGGGGGGSILLNVSGTVSNISVFARGGNGGNQLTGSGNEAEGPGGGGGGGQIAITGTPSITSSTTGGLYGTTASSGLTEFVPNGATMAGTGSTTPGLPYDEPPVFSGVLAVRLLWFKANSTAQNGISVQWSVTDEEGATYHVEKSHDQLQWETIGTKKAANNTGINNYSITSSELSANAYFRLKIVSRNGSVSFSNIVLVKTSLVTKAYVYSTGNELSVANVPAAAKSICIYSNNGQMVYRMLSNKQMMQTIPTNHLGKGIYNVVIDYDTEMQVLRFVK